MDILKKKINRIEGRGYKAYKDLKGVYNFKKYELHIDYVQSDPFAPPSLIRIKVPQGIAGFPHHTYSTKSREIAVRDFIARSLKRAIGKSSKGIRGTGKSGVISVAPAGQEVLERTAVMVDREYVEARLTVGMPAYGRRIAAKQAEEIFFKEMPGIVEMATFYARLDKRALEKHIAYMEDADFLREKLNDFGLVAFVSDDAVLPRKSGVDASPLTEGNIIPFSSPGTMRTEVELPNTGRISGMGIGKGITLIVGGGFHGKSTLLNAVELGVYNHIPGDGREFVVTVPGAAKIRAEDGRRVEKVDISSFIANLPLGRDTNNFSTENASGSTSQAANIIEAIETGSKLLLLDEDTSATNFMIRDHRMQELVSKDKEPITPFIDKVRFLYREFGISTILVMGGSGDYFDVADSVICMEDYRPFNVTVKAKNIAETYKTKRKKEGGGNFGDIRQRIPRVGSINPSRGRKDVKISVKGLQTIIFGNHTIDLSGLEQLVDRGQTKAIGDAVYYATRYMDDKKTLKQVLDVVDEDIEAKGLDVLSPAVTGEYVSFRKHEFSAAINRLRTLSII